MSSSSCVTTQWLPRTFSSPASLKSELRLRHQFGFTAGVTILERNKLFWFTDYQGTRTGLQGARNRNRFTVPPADRASGGNFDPSLFGTTQTVNGGFATTGPTLISRSDGTRWLNL